MGLISDQNHVGRNVVIVGGVAGFLALIAALLRVWAKQIKGSRLDASDWTCFAGLVFALTLLGSTVNTAIQGLGLPVEQISMEQFVAFSKGLLVGILTWTASNTLIRISMILLYMRLFPSRNFIIFCWAFLIENVLCAFATLIATCLICTPFEYNWNRMISGHCGNQKQFYLWHGIQNLVSDVIIIMMPMPFLWRLQMPWRKKLSLSLVFAMGTAICVITLVRTIDVARADLHSITSDYASVGLLSLLEPLLGVVNCSLPLLRPVFQFLGEKLGLKDRQSSTSRSSRPSFLPSIGSKATRPKVHDPYPLDTIMSTSTTYHVGTRRSSMGDGESLTNLVENARGTERIRAKTEWNVRYGTGF